MKYKIITAFAEDLAQHVQYHIDDGWELVSAPFVFRSSKFHIELAQAVVRPSEPLKAVSPRRDGQN